MGSDDRRDGFVVTGSGGLYLTGAINRKASWSQDPAAAVVFGDKRAADTVVELHGMCIAVPFAYVPVPKSLGQVAMDAAVRRGYPIMNGFAICSDTSADDWEVVAQAVVEEHERRKK